MQSLLLLTVDFLLINVTTAQESLVTQPASKRSTPYDSAVVLSHHLPTTDLEWCCAFCCPANVTDDVDVALTMTLTNESMKVDFLETVLASLEWGSTFVIFDQQHGKMCQQLNGRTDKRTGGWIDGRTD